MAVTDYATYGVKYKLYDAESDKYSTRTLSGLNVSGSATGKDMVNVESLSSALFGYIYDDTTYGNNTLSSLGSASFTIASIEKSQLVTRV